MPAYNAERTIAASARSALNQTYTDWELIVVDDRSTDDTAAIIAGLAAADDRVRIQRQPQRGGAAAARNSGVAMARGEWVAFLDADDVWMPDKLARQLAFMARREARISYTASAFMDSAGRRYSYIMPAVERLTYDQLLRRNLMSCSSVVCQRELLLRYPFPDRSLVHEDYCVWLRIVREVGVAYGLNEPLLTYRLSAGSQSAGRVRSALMTYRAYREVGFNPAASAALTARYAAWSVGKRLIIRSGFRGGFQGGI
jgi:teichuronic acid biosynthesis glycosyltransferase TuaG